MVNKQKKISDTITAMCLNQPPDPAFRSQKPLTSKNSPPILPLSIKKLQQIQNQFHVWHYKRQLRLEEKIEG